MIGVVLKTSTSNILKSLLIERLENGEIAVPAVVWQEYEEMFDEEAEIIAPHVRPYDRQSDLYAASICMVEKYTLLTTPEQVPYFKGWGCCEVADLPAWAKSQGA